MTAALAPRYDAPDAWADGPGRGYDRLASWLVGLAPAPLTGKRVLDLGAGTGAASRACAALGARPVATDLSLAMLAHARHTRPPAVCADAVALPFAPASVDAVVAAFSLTHIPDLTRAVAECARVLVPGGALVGCGFTARFQHPAKALIEQVLRAAGWEPPAWYLQLKQTAEEQFAEPFAVLDLAAGFGSARAVVERVDTGLRTPEDLVRWRLGMPTCAGFLAALTPAERADLFAEALRAVTPHAEPLRPEVVALVATR